MSRVTSKYQVTLPKKIAETYSIRPGDDIEWVPAGDVIRVVPTGKEVSQLDHSKLRLFDQASERHRKRLSAKTGKVPRSRGWKREDLYQRGRAR